MSTLHPKEFKVVALRECPLPEDMHICETPQHAADYWRLHIPTEPHFDPERECFAVLMLNTRKRIKGHHFVSIGTLDTIHIHPREVFRAAIIAAAASIVLLHNHPSGDPTPSEADTGRAVIFASAVELNEHQMYNRVGIEIRARHL
jgi:DNA repair protein RadC